MVCRGRAMEGGHIDIHVELWKRRREEPHGMRLVMFWNPEKKDINHFLVYFEIQRRNMCR
jgi:hypothetical protein